MMKTRKIGAVVAVAFGLMLAVPVTAQDACQNALTHISQANATIVGMKDLFAQIAKRKADQTVSGSAVAVEDNYGPLKCPACGMMMPNKPKGNLTKAVKYNGKTYYCCKGCDMSATADKE